MGDIIKTLLVAAALIGLPSFIIYDVSVRDPERRAERNAKAEVLVNGNAKDVHTLVDRKTGRTLRIVTIDGNPLTLSDEPTPVPAVEPAR